MSSNFDKTVWPEGTFDFKKWFESWGRRWAHNYPLQRLDLESAFTAGYVSAVRNHDAAMRRKAEWEVLDDYPTGQSGSK